MADPNLLKQTKTYLRSTLLSHKGSITTTQLDNDYRELVGDFIPYSRLKFHDLESFLSTIPDVCHVQQDGGQLVVVGVAGKASAHIKEMVARQKVKSVGGRKNRGYGGGGGYGGGKGGRPGYKYNNYNFDLSDGSDWENYNIKTKTGERAKLVEVAKAVPAGYEDTEDEDDDLSAYSCVPVQLRSTNIEVVTSCPTNNLSKAVASLSISNSPLPGQETKLPPLLSPPALIHSGSLPPSPLSSHTTYSDLIVSQVTSPHQFSVQPLHSMQLYHSLSVQMNNLYTTSIPHTVPSEALVQGSVVAAKHQESWYRAEVTKLLRSHFLVCLRLVDTGKVILCTSRQDIQPLWSMFGELPVQAVGARLAGVRPESGSSWWQVETDWFRETVLDRAWAGVIKKVVLGEHKQAVLVMELYDTSKEEDFEVGEEMRRLGLANSE